MLKDKRGDNVDSDYTLSIEIKKIKDLNLYFQKMQIEDKFDGKSNEEKTKYLMDILNNNIIGESQFVLDELYVPSGYYYELYIILSNDEYVAIRLGYNDPYYEIAEKYPEFYLLGEDVVWNIDINEMIDFIINKKKNIPQEFIKIYDFRLGRMPCR